MADKVEMQLGVDASGVKTGMGDANKNLQDGLSKFKGSFNAAQSGPSGLAGSIKKLIPAFGAATAAAYAYKKVMDSLKFADALMDDAEALRTNVETLQVLRVTAEEAGAGAKTLDKGIVSLQKSLLDAANGNEKLSDAFKTLGVDAESLLALPLEEQMEALGRAYITSGEGLESYGAIMEILGAQNGPKLIGTLKELGKEGFESVTDAAKSTGRVLEDEFVKQLDDANKKLEKWGNTTKIWFASATSGVLTFGEALTKSFKQSMDSFFRPEEGAVVKSVSENMDDIRGGNAAEMQRAKEEQANQQKLAAQAEANRRARAKEQAEQDAADKELAKSREKDAEARKRSIEKFNKLRDDLRKKDVEKEKKAAKEKEKYFDEYAKNRDAAEKGLADATKKISDDEKKLRDEKIAAERELTKELRGQLAARESITKEIASGDASGTGGGDVKAAQRVEKDRAEAERQSARGNFGKAGQLEARAAQREEALHDRRRSRFMDAYKNERDPDVRAQMREEGRNQGFDKDSKSLKEVQLREDKEKAEEQFWKKEEREKLQGSVDQMKTHLGTIAAYIGTATTEIEENQKQSASAGTGGKTAPKAPTAPKAAAQPASKK